MTSNKIARGVFSTYRKRAFFALLGLMLLAAASFVPAFPWSARWRHTLKKTIASVEMRVARWRGYEPRLLSISGKVDLPGAEVQALDSRSGWAELADSEGRFVLPDLMWYPDASCEIVVSTDEQNAKLFKITMPREFPDGGLFSIGQLKADQGKDVDLNRLPGITVATYDAYDVENDSYYKRLAEEITAGKQSDEEKVDAINNYLAARFNYDATEPAASPRRVLEQGSQYCGYMSGAMRALLAAVNYRTRAVDMRDGKTPPKTHVVVEVLYAGRWHLYDPTYGIKLRNQDGDVADYKEVRLEPGLIKEDQLTRFEPNRRREIFSLLQAVYSTGYHHFYYFKSFE